MKKTTCRIFLIVLTIVMAFNFCMIANAESKLMNRYNVVLVTDASGSMKDTDPDGYRFESIDLFVSLLANGGNHVGSVVFSDGVISKHDLVNITGRSEKDSITSQIRNTEVDGWTDTGSALMEAINMLEKGGNKELPSIIILLTDGNTDMGDEELTAQSIAKKEEAMEIARSKGYNIYTISLNKDNSANSNELKQIASATGGQFQEVTNAEDLQSVFDLYYQMIYSTNSMKLVDETVPASGAISRNFDVADLGVEEVNIVVFGKLSQIILKKPDGSTIPDAQMQKILYKSNTFTLIKIAEPEKGVWNLTVKSDPGSKLKIFKIYNSNLQVDASIVNPKDSYVIGSAVNFNAKIKENDTLITDVARYAGYKALLTVNDYEGNTVHTQEVSKPGASGFETTFTPADYGTYYAKISVETSELFSESEVFTISVGNTAPIANAEVIKKHINRWPFFIKTDSTIDLSQTATDAEDSTLTYKVKSSTWMEDDYTLDGDKLTINKFSVSKGSFTIEASDSLGAYCSYDVKVTSTNIGLWVVILMLLGILIVLAAIGIKTYIDYGRPFMGTFTVENTTTHESSTMQKSRGRLKLTSLQIGQTGLDKGCYFQATGKNYVYFVSKKPFYSDSSFKKTKKLKVESSMEVKISTNPEYSDGVIIRFESMLNNTF